MAKSNTTKAKSHPAGAGEVVSLKNLKVGKVQNDERGSSAAKHPRSSSTRADIRAIEHRTMGSRQSKKPVERSNQRRQPKTGGTGGHGNAGKADRTGVTASKKK